MYTPGTHHPVPTLVYPPTTWHPPTLPAPGVALAVAGPVQRCLRTVHQAHIGKMEILSLPSQTGTVSHSQEWPGLDVLTTFQRPEMIRLLIRRNTFGIFPIWEQRDYLCSECQYWPKDAKTGIARKLHEDNVPFHSRINKSNSTPQSGSFSRRLRYPALVRVSGFGAGSLLTRFRRNRSFPCSEIRPEWTRIMARTGQ